MSNPAMGVEAPLPKRIPHMKMIMDQGVLTEEILNYPYEGSGTEDDPYRVQWIENDPRNPMLFPAFKKWVYTVFMAVSTLAVAFISSAFSGGSRQIIEQFDCSEEVFTLGISLFVLGFAVGPLIWAPLSELFGRQYLFAFTYLIVTIFNAGAVASQNVWTLIILRFFAGSFGSSPLTNAGGVIADMFPSRQRGVAMTVFAAAPFMGPTLGPFIGGFIAENVGWRWLEAVMAFFTLVVLIVGIFLVPETYSPVLLRRRAEALSKATGKVYWSKMDVIHGKTTIGHAFKTSLSRPWVLLIMEPIVLLLSLYMAIVYGTLYMLFGAFPIVFQEGRGWSEGIGGLAFIGVMVGMIIAVFYAIFDNRRYIRAMDRDPSGFAPPEARLPPAMIGGLALPVGLIWFAWTNSPSIHWIVSIIAGAPFGFGMVLVFLAIMNYLIDAYVIFAASVLAANSVLRSLFGAIFPLFTSYMFKNLGIHWASMVPAFLALACTPFPFLFYKYGPAIRVRCRFAAEAQKFIDDMRAPPQDEEFSDDEADIMSDVGSEKGEDDTAVDPHAQRTKPPRELFEEEEAEKEAEALDFSYEEEPGSSGGRFQGIRAPNRRRSNLALSKTDSYISDRGTYEASPFDIDRVNTHESFGRARSNSAISRQTSRTSRLSRYSSNRSNRTGKSNKRSSMRNSMPPPE